MLRTSFKSFFLLANLALAPAIFAAGDSYVPGAGRGADTLTPDQVSIVGISSRPSNDSGVFIGAGASLGQGRTTEGSSAGVAFLGHVEPGYQVSTGSWSRLEFGLDLFSGAVNYRLPDDRPVGGKVSYPGLYGVLAKAGYGYSLGENLFGVLKFGVGPVSAGLNIVTAAAGTAKADNVSGLAWQLGWEAVAPMGRSFDFTFGISWMQMQFDVGKLQENGVSFNFNRSMIVNIPAIDLGLRLRL